MSTSDGGGGGGRMSENAQARAALASRRRRREALQQQQQHGVGGEAPEGEGGGEPAPAPAQARPPTAALRGAGGGERPGRRPPPPPQRAAASPPPRPPRQARAAPESPMSTVKSLLSSLRTDLSATAVGAAVGAGAGAEDGAGRPGEVGEYRIRRGDLPGIASAQAGGGGAAEEGGSGSDSDNDGAGGGDRGPPAMERSLDDGSESWSDSDDGSGDGGGGGLGGSPVLVEASGGPSQTPPGAADGGYSLLRPGEPDVLDAACLPFGSSVAVRSTAPRVGGGGERGGPSASSAVLSSLSASAPGAGAGEGPDRGHPRAASAVLDGTGTGGGLWEILVLEGAYSDGGTGAGGGATPPPRGGAAPREPQRPPLGDVLRYGGAVSLRCRHAGNRWLGVRAASVASSPGGGGGRSIEVGFYRTVRGQAERWEVLPSRGDGATVPVGPEAALAAAAAAGGGGAGARASADGPGRSGRATPSSCATFRRGGCSPWAAGPPPPWSPPLGGRGTSRWSRPPIRRQPTAADRQPTIGPCWTSSSTRTGSSLPPARRSGSSTRQLLPARRG